VTEIKKTKGRNGIPHIEITDSYFNAFITKQTERTQPIYKAFLRFLYEFDSDINGQKMLEEKEQWEQRII